MMRRPLLKRAVAMGLACVWLGVPTTALGAVRADFNDDGRGDLAVGVPFENLGSVSDAGAVNVLYGGAGGLSATGNQFWRQNSSGVLGASESGDNFGWALAAGDFNDDGRDDLAVGVPEEDLSGLNAVGAVSVLYGGAGGLSATGNQLWSQDSPGVLDASETFDHFGYALAVGDLNGDGRDDLAIGVDSEDIASVNAAGAVSVLYGGAGGLSATGNQFWSQNSADILNVSEASDRFGEFLAAGDLDGDSHDDLAVGVPSEDLGDNVPDAGAVNVLYGDAGGLSATGNQFWHQNSPGVLDAAEGLDAFGGFALAAGDFNNDARDDLAIAVTSENLPSAVDAGAVNVLYGGNGGLSATGNQFWHQNSPGVLDAAEVLDFFSWGLAAGDLNGDGRDDLAVGVPFEDLGSDNAGAVNVLYGGAGGLSATGNQFWSQDSAGILDAAEEGDNFGRTVAAGDLNGDSRDDMAAGVVSEAVGTIPGAGAANVLYSDPGGLSATGNQFWHQDSAGIADTAENADGFGASFAAGDPP